jgi:hypothetical protein
MNNWFVNNREVIRNLALNTGTSTTPAFTALCTTSELTLNVDNEVKDFFVFCDAIKRSVITGTSLQLSATVKIDINNTAIQTALGDLHTLITSGEVAQFNNQLVQFELLDEVSGTTLSYVKYQVPVVMNISELGGAAEDEGEFALELNFNGKGTVVSQ